MFVVNCLLISLCLFAISANGQFLQNNRLRRRLPMKSAMKLKQRLQNQILQYRQRMTKTICYDIVGCFDLPHKRSPLQKIPENPDLLDTKFYLFRQNLSQPEVILFNDNNKSLNQSHFDYSQPLKMILHGYMGRWNSEGNMMGMDSYLKIYNCNVILMDWSIGARGPQYTIAAANTEVVGRQLGMLLLDIIERGLDPKTIHLLGFSLGAHVAGSASEVLKKKGHLIGRITGLDPASPLFRTNHLREKNKKLDRTDAHFVDAIHTDSSPYATDGFGLWEPIGHVDFFPNGGQEQPGCTDVKQSIVVTHFEGGLTKEIACSHIRAWRLFQETLNNKALKLENRCEFIAFSCPTGLPSFERGHCFPQLDKSDNPSYRNEIGRLGEDVKGEGVMYLATQATSPYCGSQLQASVFVSQKTGPVTGILYLHLSYLNYSVDFQIICQTSDYIMTGTIMSGLSTANYNSLTDQVGQISSVLSFVNSESNPNNTIYPTVLYIDKVSVRDMYGNSWQFCKKDTALKHLAGQNLNKNLVLSKKLC